MDLHIDAVADHADGAVSIGNVQSGVMCCRSHGKQYSFGVDLCWGGEMQVVQKR